MRAAVPLVMLFASGCAGRPSAMPSGPDWSRFALERSGADGPSGLAWRPDVCAGADLRPEHRRLDESHLLAFLREHGMDARIERQAVEANKPDLLFVFLAVPGASQTVPLRVAILRSTDEAGSELYKALLQHGAGTWGVHRANIAVLGPAGATEDDVAFAGKTKLACWGTFTFVDGDEAVVVPGGYTEP